MKYFWKIACCGLLLGFEAMPAVACSKIGGIISYDFLGNNQYQVTVRLYHDCSGVPAPTSVDLCFSSASGAYSNTTYLGLVGTGVVLPSPPNYPNMYSSCNGGPGPGADRYTYSSVLTLPFAATDWEVSCTLFGTFINGLGNSLISTKINNQDYQGNSSMRFIDDPVIHYCVNQPAINNLQAMDPDGDSLVYSLHPMFVSNDLNCPAIPEYPIPQSLLPQSSVPVAIGANDGWVYFEPTTVEDAYLHVQVDEYRSGVMINSTTMFQQAKIISGCTPTAVEDVTGTYFSIGSNPVVNDLEIYSEDQGNLSIEVLDPSGKICIADININHRGKYTLNVMHLTEGIYFARINNEAGSHIKKFVKISSR